MINGCRMKKRLFIMASIVSILLSSTVALSPTGESNRTPFPYPPASEIIFIHPKMAVVVYPDRFTNCTVPLLVNVPFINGSTNATVSLYANNFIIPYSIDYPIQLLNMEGVQYGQNKTAFFNVTMTFRNRMMSSSEMFSFYAKIIYKPTSKISFAPLTSVNICFLQYSNFSVRAGFSETADIVQGEEKIFTVNIYNDGNGWQDAFRLELDNNATLKDAGLMIIAPTNVSLGPQRNKTVDVKVSVNKNTKPGTYHLSLHVQSTMVPSSRDESKNNTINITVIVDEKGILGVLDGTTTLIIVITTIVIVGVAIVVYQKWKRKISMRDSH